MSGTVVAALTQTRNAFADMPASLEGLPDLAGRLEDVRKANVDHHLELLARARHAGAELIGFGELFPGPYFALEHRELWRGLAEDALEGPTVSAVRSAAQAEGMVVVAPIYELDAATGTCFNTAVVVDASGEVLGRYRKVHIPQGTNELGSFHEQRYYERSDGALGNDPGRLVRDHPYFPVFRTRAAAVGVAICYDRHFEGVMSTLASGGARIVFSPAVTFGEKSRRMWSHEFAVDAMRHRLFIGGSNRFGNEPPWKIEYFGESGFWGPGGLLPDLCGDPQLVVSALELAELDGDDPSGWNLARDARPETFGL